MKGVEIVRHQLSLAIRVEDHFSGAPWPDELAVALDTGEPAVRARAGGSRHADGTYRFVGLAGGPRQISVSAPDGGAFTWSASTGVVLPLGNPATPVVVEAYPAAGARVAPGTLVIRGKLVVAGAGQEVQIQAAGVTPPRIRRTRSDAAGEFAFVVVGPVALDANGRVRLTANVPGRTLVSVQLVDGNTNPTIVGSAFAVPPGREIRARFNLT